MKGIILVRHGEGENNVGEVTGGWSDVGLTERGMEQVEVLVRRLLDELAGKRLRICSSDLRRAVQSAGIIGKALGFDITYSKALREHNNGEAAGKTKKEAEQFFIQPTQPLVDWRPYPGAESWREFYERVAGYMNSLDMGLDECLLIVTHGGTIINLVAWWLGLGPEARNQICFRTSNASITVLNENELGQRQLERLNDSAHLHAVGMTDRIRL